MTIGEVLDRRAVNRATLARQMLLGRVASPVTDVLERLVGLQAQTPHSWYVGLWNRVAGFTPGQAADLLTGREAVRMALMRSTIHLVTARDALWLRPLVQPVIERSTKGAFGGHWVGLDRDEVTAVGRSLVEERPLTPSRLGALLAEHGLGAGWGERDPAALAQAVRAWVPLVQVPPRGVWGTSGPIAHTSAEAWLGRPPADDPPLEDLVLRYLAAFGPATVKDVQTWSGLTRLREVTDRLGSRLVTFRDEEGRELLDLPDAPRPGPDVPATARFMYDFDNLFLSHADRGRVVTDVCRAQDFGRNIQPSLLLVDGFTEGAWKIVRSGDTAALVVKPFRRLTGAEHDDVADEGARLLEFAEADAAVKEVRFMRHDVAEMPWTTTGNG
ncbi:winged helix DNA-binding domain-containing protein [Thermomonospora umbrina]|uniref:Winged helix DNA-binding protein n=1 Tax=Thermomonospora umbrina TaxID=111806 RepID=A0A3D9SW49_9ACTN|nr:winged helix DNA-binding domain-containing protein [Thermomonospora umbrina]REF00180.1 winged helix DNA-binding protein [Thermomonospora umbrina]